MDFLEKLRKKSVQERKIILWSTLAVIGVILVVLWIGASKRAIKSFNTETILNSIEAPQIEEFPKIEEPAQGPGYTEQELEEFKKMIEELEKQENGQKEE